MILRVPRQWLIPAVLGALFLGLVPAVSQLDYSFMPKGGKALLLDLFGDKPDKKDLLDTLAARRSEAEWQKSLAERAKGMGERERQTLAAYLAINMPLKDPEQVARATKPEQLLAALPRDGRELGFYECQYCHSLFTSHLTQARSFQAWMNMFQSPFHRELKMTRQEREEFSRYSEINMPMKIEDVPQDLRF